MAKFVEKRIVKILSNISIGLILAFLLSLVLFLFNNVFAYGFFLMPCAIPFLFLESLLSDKNKYTRDFLELYRYKLDNVKSLDDLYDIQSGFESIAVEDGIYCLSYKVSLKNMHQEILNKIEILESISK